MKTIGYLLMVSALSLWAATIQAMTLCEREICARLAPFDENQTQIKPGDAFYMTLAYKINGPENSTDELLAFGFTVSHSAEIAYLGHQLS